METQFFIVPNHLSSFTVLQMAYSVSMMAIIPNKMNFQSSILNANIKNHELIDWENCSRNTHLEQMSFDQKCHFE
jgi:hypothetical protein